jgi:conjugal transfer pilus assembly protein TraB
MDKLAEFSIKRAESMSPVAYVASGRVLDAVLMRGVDLSPIVQDSLQLVNSNSQNQSQDTSEPQGNN